MYRGYSQGIVASVQWSQPRLETLAPDFIGCDYDLHALRRGELTAGLPHVASGRFEFDFVRLAPEQNQTFYAAGAGICHRLLIGIENVEREVVAACDELPVLLAAVGIDNVAALRSLSPLAVAVSKRRAHQGQAQDQHK